VSTPRTGSTPSHVDTPASVPRLIEAPLAVFDADRDTSRRCLLSASAPFGAKRARSAECTSQSTSRGELLAWEVNRLLRYIDTQLADKITTKNLARLIDVSERRLFRALKIPVDDSPSLHHHAPRRARMHEGAARPASPRVRILRPGASLQTVSPQNRYAPIGLASRDDNPIRRSGRLRQGFAC
jgi:hypothetical protein